MSRNFRDQFRPSQYQAGRRGALVAGSYLALVLGVAVFVTVTLFLPSDDANLAGVWLYFVTAPVSMLTLPIEIWAASALSGPALLAVSAVELSLAAMLQAGMLWLLFRGKRFPERSPQQV